VIYDPANAGFSHLAANALSREIAFRRAILTARGLMLSPPASTNTPGLFNFIKNIGSASDVDAFDIRGDYHFNERNRLSAVLTYSENRQRQ